MKKGELDRAILATYKLSLDKEDSLEGLLLLLRNNREFLTELIHGWLEENMRAYLYLRSLNMPVPYHEFLVVGEIVPNLFANAVRLAFAPPDPTKDIDESEISEEEEIKIGQAWLQKAFPEIFEDIQAESASTMAYLESEAGKKRSQAGVDSCFSKIRNLPDPND